MQLNFWERQFVNSPLRWALQRLVVQWFKGTIHIEPGSGVLEIGCGRGAGAKMILRQFDPARLFLLEVDWRMIGAALRHLADDNGRVSFACGDASALPFKDESLDAVFGFGYLHHVIAWRRSISDVSRVLKQGGVYYMEEYYPSFYQNAVTRHIFRHPDQDRFNSQDLRQAFSEANLTLTHTFELKKMGILGVGVKARQEAIRCKRSESSCYIKIDE